MHLVMVYAVVLAQARVVTKKKYSSKVVTTRSRALFSSIAYASVPARPAGVSRTMPVLVLVLVLSFFFFFLGFATHVNMLALVVK
jgi:hypothetical protein